MIHAADVVRGTQARSGAGEDAVMGLPPAPVCHASLPVTKLPYLVKLPLEGGLVLKAGDTWPKTSRVYCHPFEEDWPEEPNVVEAVPVVFCRRRGAAIDLVLDRPRLARSQFVFTE